MALSRRAAGAAVSRLVQNRTRLHVGPVVLRSFASTSQRLDASTQPLVQPEGIPETPTDTPPYQKDGYLFLDSVFPIRIGRWDLRHYIGLFRKDTLLTQLNHILSNVHAYQFEVVQLQPYVKDGGVYIHYRYSVPYGTSAEDVEKASDEVEKAMEAAIAKNGGVPRWLGFNWGRGEVWPVKGRPWREDLNRYASPYLRIAFDGPDVPEEALYDLLRPYGRITVMDLPSSAPPPPAGVPRSALIRFHSLRSSAVARNVLHGYDFQPLAGPSGAQPPKTRLRTMYQPPVQEHALRDWIAKHPRIVAPIALFLLGSLTYTVWDPIRTLMVEGKVMDWFDYRNYDSYQWLHANILSHLPWVAPPILKKATDDDEEDGIEFNSVAGEHHRLRRKRKPKPNDNDEEVWQARHEASDALIRYLTDSPSTIAFLHGPAGSGKDPLLKEAVASTGSRRTLIIDCTALLKNSSDSGLVNSLASQTGYWPVFTFLNNFNTWIDLAAVGLIGQKAGLATSLPDQVKQVLTVVGSALGGVNTSYKKEVEKEALRQSKKAKRREQEEEREEKVKKGEWHDPRLDAVAGNGVTSELGVGDEKLDGMSMEKDLSPSSKTDAATAKEGKIEEKTEDMPAKSSWLPSVSLPSMPSLPSLPEVPSTIKDLTSLPGRILGSSSDSKTTQNEDNGNALDPDRLRRESADAQAIRALPILVIKNYNARGGGHKDSEEVMDVIASWAAGLVENNTAHVVVISDKRDNSKRLAKVMPRKPLAMIGMSDADTASALKYVKKELSTPSSTGGQAPLTTQVELDKFEIARIEQLGGRASDLESLIHKVRAGQTVSDAVDDIIRRDVGELRKNAFGDDVDDAKRLQWTREQAWSLFRRMTKKEEVPYYEVLVGMFGGDEAALRSMEHAELISISTDNGGRPTFIRPGKPVYKYVFERLASDPVFAATQDLALNTKAAATAETTIKACEDELYKLHEIGSSRAVRKREDYLLTKMKKAQDTLESLEYQAGELKKVLAKGG